MGSVVSRGTACWGLTARRRRGVEHSGSLTSAPQSGRGHAGIRCRASLAPSRRMVGCGHSQAGSITFSTSPPQWESCRYTNISCVGILGLRAWCEGRVGRLIDEAGRREGAFLVGGLVGVEILVVAGSVPLPSSSIVGRWCRSRRSASAQVAPRVAGLRAGLVAPLTA